MSNDMTPTRGIASLLAFVVLATFVGGCSRAEKTYPASGTVHVNGKPVEGVYVVLHLLDPSKQGAKSASARTDADGQFSMRVRGLGEYAVTAFWPLVTKDQQETIEGEDRFRGKYYNAEKPITTATITNGDNELPLIQLKYP